MPNLTSPAQQPDITVLITIFNTEQYLAEAIESVLTQNTLRTWELLLVDDGSSDNSLRVALDYATRYPGQIVVLRHPGGRNRGISASRNLGLRHARGQYLAFLDSDDVWLAHHLETQTALLERLPGVAMIYAGAERWVDFNQPFEEASARAATWGQNYLPPLVPSGKNAGLLPRGLLLHWFRGDESTVPCICTVVVRTAVARAVGGFCDAFRGLYDDQVFHAKVSLGYAIYANDICVARYRQHAASCCARSRVTTDEQRRTHEQFNAFLAGYLSDESQSHGTQLQPLRAN